VALEKYYLTSKKNSLTAAYKMMIKEFYAEDVYHEGGQERVVIMDESLLPTMAQFKYWFHKEHSIQETLLARQGRNNTRKIIGQSLVHPLSKFLVRDLVFK
jgi:hypothetical protein